MEQKLSWGTKMISSLVGLISMAAVVLILGQASSSAQGSAPSNVCVTRTVRCAVTPGTTRGAPCQCFVPPATWIPGIAEYWVSVPSEIP